MIYIFFSSLNFDLINSFLTLKETPESIQLIGKDWKETLVISEIVGLHQEIDVNSVQVTGGTGGLANVNSSTILIEFIFNEDQGFELDAELVLNGKGTDSIGKSTELPKIHNLITT